MSFGQDEEGRRVFLSVDSRAVSENPLYRAFRTKSFTDRDISLHFHILDILSGVDGLSIKGVMDELTDRLSGFDLDGLPDESTVRKKLKEYAALGLVLVEKRGRETFYVLSEDRLDIASWDAAAAFFAEASPLGVIGSFFQDRLPEKFQHFRFKHHYILNALDSEILYELFSAIGERRLITFTARSQRTKALPLQIYTGTQTGRQYLLAWSPGNQRFFFYRVDLMDQVGKGETVLYPPDMIARLDEFRSHSWGVTGNNKARMDHIEMTVYVGPDEGHIIGRLEREKRCGTVEKLDETHWRFSADVYEALEMLPWLRTFTGRVTDLQCSDEFVTSRFRDDLDQMYQMYSLSH